MWQCCSELALFTGHPVAVASSDHTPVAGAGDGMEDQTDMEEEENELVLLDPSHVSWCGVWLAVWITNLSLSHTHIHTHTRHTASYGACPSRTHRSTY